MGRVHFDAPFFIRRTVWIDRRACVMCMGIFVRFDCLTSMPLTLLFPPGPLYAHYRAVEDALDFARRMHERQLALRSAHRSSYEPDVHAIVLAFNLRVIGRKMDALIAAFRSEIRVGQCGGISQATSELQAALQHYNAAVATRDAWDNLVDASVNVIDLAFDCLASLESDILAFEQQN